MKILFIHPQYRDYRRELFKKLNKTLDITFLFIVPEMVDTRKHKPVSAIPPNLRSKMDYLCLNLKGVKIPELSLGELFHMLKGLTKEILSGKYDVIVSHTEHPIHSKISFILAKLARKKFIIWGAESWKKNPFEPLHYRLYHRFADFILRHSDACLVYGSYSKKYCETVGVPKHKIFIFPLCSNDLKRRPINKDIRKELNLKNQKVILYLSRIIKRKGLDLLIKAFSKLEKEIDNVFLLVVGDGDFRNNCESLAQRLEVSNVLFYGVVDPDDAPSFYQACDLFVLPSWPYKGQLEGWGMVINEAASMGKPIITTDAVGAAPDLVKNGYNGYIVRSNCVEDLHERMKQILINPELAKKMGTNSRIVFEEYNDLAKAANIFKQALDYN